MLKFIHRFIDGMFLSVFTISTLSAFVALLGGSFIVYVLLILVAGFCFANYKGAE